MHVRRSYTFLGDIEQCYALAVRPRRVAGRAWLAWVGVALVGVQGAVRPRPAPRAFAQEEAVSRMSNTGGGKTPQ